MIVKITTLGDVNVRTGAGMEFGSNRTVKAGTTLTSSNQRKDPIGNIWYEVQQGWICGKYVTLDKDLQKPDLNKRMKKLQRQILQRFDDEEEEEEEGGDDDGETVELTEEEVEQRRRQNSGYNVDGSVGIDVNQGDITDGSLIPRGSQRNVENENANDIHLGRRIFGVPYQFLPSTDLRVSDVGGTTDPELGLAYTEMMNEAPILCVLPGKPMFLPDLSDDQKKNFINMMTDKIHEMNSAITRVVPGSADDNMDTRFFSFATDYSDFIRYFNTLCQMCAIMMGLGGDTMPPGSNEFYQFRFFNWAGYALANILAGRNSKNGTLNGANEGAVGQLKTTASDARDAAVGALNAFMSGDKQKLIDIAKAFDASSMYTDFYINPAISYSENFNNSVSASAIAGMFESASDMAKDIGFLLNTGAVNQDLVDKSNESAARALDSVVKKNLEGNNGILGRLIKGTTTVLSGANLIFPDIWKNSTYSKSYSIEIPLSTPYGSRRNIFLDILVPMLFWVTLAAPRQYSVNSYGSPFLVRCHVPGIFSVDCGIVESLTITKGGDGSAWSVDGFPLQMNLSVSIRDLYSEIPISAINGASFTDAYNFLWNTALIDYISVQSGMNMKTSELMKKLDVAEALARNVGRQATYSARIRAQETWVNSQTLAMGARSAAKKIGGAFGI